ncbi:hypothetical protein AURDEDRAFT_78103 [Auricularia subglabra TFB-10046 SS5]|nr:hypothetical protein AURDEDRAFT_78103 [Auricularia subglabra TFB-10046 SS5]
MPWQTEFTLGRRGKGCYLVTEEITRHLQKGLEQTKAHRCFVLVHHTSAALTINENYDPGARFLLSRDMNDALDHIVPEDLKWRHVDEGPDDSTSHVKTSLVGNSIQIPITDYRLNLGTWQGIYLTEFRHIPHSRRIVATILP